MNIIQSPFSHIRKIFELKGVLTKNACVFLTISLLIACAGTQSTNQTDSETSYRPASADADHASGSDRSPSGAKALMLNSSSSDSCSYPDGDKTDWWYIDIPAQGKLTLTLNIKSAGNDLNLTMIDNSGAALASSRGGESVVKEVVEKDVIEGRYYVRVYAVNEADKSAYELLNTFNQADGIPIPGISYENEKGKQDGINAVIIPEKTEIVKTEPLKEQPKEEPKLPELSTLECDQGIEIQQITPMLAKEIGISESMGLVIVQVVDDSPAKGAGFRRGDIILAIDEMPVKKVNMFAHRIQKYRSGDTILFLIRRGSDTLYMILKVKKPLSNT